MSQPDVIQQRLTQDWRGRERVKVRVRVRWRVKARVRGRVKIRVRGLGGREGGREGETYRTMYMHTVRSHRSYISV